MKRRSNHVSVLLATGAASVILTACGDEPVQTQKIYTTAAECVAQGNDKSSCDAAFAQAKTQQLTAAPQFSKKEQCEAEFGVGNCETARVSSGGSSSDVFMPAMMGFMVGQALGNAGAANSYYDDRRERDRYYAVPQPVYVDRYGDMHSSRGYVGTAKKSSTGKYVAPRTVSLPSSYSSSSSSSYKSPSTSSRGAFGASASRYGGVSA